MLQLLWLRHLMLMIVDVSAEITSIRLEETTIHEMIMTAIQCKTEYCS